MYSPTLIMASCLVLAVVCGCTAAPAGAGVPPVRPLADHPGNVFLDGEEVAVPLPPGEGGDWELLDYEGHVVRQGQAADSRAPLGKLPVGYYELRRTGQTPRVSLAVLAPLAAPTPATSPIALDVAMSWFYKDPQKPAVASLCALAGANWVRDRLNWREIQPKPGQFAPVGKYDESARVQAAAGLRVLQVNHIGPAWEPDGKRFPTDLRDAYRFYREMARRWQGQVLAFEPWNEADIDVFGGHSGAEMASMQKASYLGLKAGNPDVVACLNVFAVNRRATLDDLAANQAWPYFDTCNLHHYIALDQYPSWYAAFRAVSAGKPLWVSEFSMPVPWTGDDKAQELSDDTLRTQAERVSMVFAGSLHEGAAAAFYFILGHYVEGKTQFGIIRKDLTPRPAYVALAAVGRLLADARPAGRLKSDQPDMRAYLFRAKPDGREREVLVAWCAGQARTLPLPPGVAPESVWDLLGRPVKTTAPAPGAGLSLSRAPLYAVLPVGSAKALVLEPPPAPPPLQHATPCPVVMQVALPKDRCVLARSAYRVSSQKRETIPIHLYHFGEAPVKGRLSVSGPQGWKIECPPAAELKPMDRLELALTVECAGPPASPVEAVTLTGDFGAAGKTVLSLRLQAEPWIHPTGAATAIPGGRDVSRWTQEVTAGSTCQLVAGADGAMTVEAKLGPGDRWVYPRLDLGQEDRPTAGVKELHLQLTAGQGEATYRVIFVEDSGAAYVGDLTPQPQPGQTVDAVVVLDQAIHGAGWSPPDPNHRLDPQHIKAIKVGCNTKADQVRYNFKDLRWVTW